jgi:hypothetical protein
MFWLLREEMFWVLKRMGSFFTSEMSRCWVVFRTEVDRVASLVGIIEICSVVSSPLVV